MRPEEPKWTPSKEALDPDRPAPEEQPRELRRIVGLFRPYRGRLAVVGLLVCASSLVRWPRRSC